MKILYVITKANFGGAQRYVYDLALSAKNEHEVVVAYGSPGRLQELLEASSIRTLPITGLVREVSLKSEWAALRELISVFRSERPDVVHVNSSKGGLALVAARIAGVKRILFTAHGWAFNENRPWWHKLILRFVYGITVLLSHTTICVSQAIKRDISFFPFLGSKLKVVYNGIDAPIFLSRKEARAKLLPPQKGKTWLGMIAELHPTKRVIDAIDAMKELDPNTLLIVMGEGQEREMLEKRILENNLTERVYLSGFVPEASTLLSAFDVFLMPSRSEALAYALIEAGYAGLPVVATAVGGIPEVVRHKESGLLVPPLSPHALARAVRTLLEDKALAKQYGAALEKRVLEKFSKERMVRETFALYR